jgi:hypothetical protein
VDNELSFSVSFPLDDDGFLRRECPSCEREFKWLPQEDSEPEPDDGYSCPYCGQRAASDAWFTRGQLRVVEGAVDENVIAPELKGLEDALGDLERTSGGLLSARIERGGHQRPRRLTEPNDMRTVRFDCHPGEPVKVLDDWDGDVHCLICGITAKP